jgi:hypothetical protein
MANLNDFKNNNTIFTGTGSITVPVGNNTTDRPGSPTVGMMRFNNVNNSLEQYTSTGWQGIEPPPVISSATGYINTNDSTTITVNGSNFKTGSAIGLYNTNTLALISNVTTTYVNGTQLTFSTGTTSSPIAAGTVISVRVTNPSGLSTQLDNAFTVDADPVITSPTPASTTNGFDLNALSISVSATNTTGGAVTYSEDTSVLSGLGLSLNSSSGAISGTIPDAQVVTITAYSNISAVESVNTHTSQTRNNLDTDMWSYNTTSNYGSYMDQSLFPLAPGNAGNSGFGLHGGHSGQVLETAIYLNTPGAVNEIAVCCHVNGPGPFTLYGSNSAYASGFRTSATWTQITTGSMNGSGSGYTDGTYMYINFTNNTSYQAYKIVWGSYSGMALYGIQLGRRDTSAATIGGSTSYPVTVRAAGATNPAQDYSTVSFYINRQRYDGTSSSRAAPSALYILQNGFSTGDGLYYISSGGTTQQMYCDMSRDGGGWMMVSSNNARDGTIPSGTGRYSTAYELDRGGSGALTSTAISPDYDYIAGVIVRTLPFTTVRCVGFGRNSTNGTYTWPSNSNRNYSTAGTYQVVFMPLTTTGTARLTEVRPLSVIRTYGASSLYTSGAAYWCMDGVQIDRVNGGYTANSNQITVGLVGVSGSSGDPTTGCYWGHGASEGNYEGWYDGSGTNQDAQGYVTWVR